MRSNFMLRFSRLFLLLCLSLNFSGLDAQDPKLEKANRYYEEGNFAKAIKLYEKGLKKGFNMQGMVRLADSYRQINEYDKAEGWYSRIVNLKEVDPIIFFHYGQVLMSNHKYLEAKDFFFRYSDLVPRDPRGEKFAISCANYRELSGMETGFEVWPFAENGKAHDLAPAWYENGVVFGVSPAQKQRSLDRDHPAFAKLYFARVSDSLRNASKPEAFPPGDAGINPDAGIAFSRDGLHVFFTRHIQEGDGPARMQLWEAEVNRNGWSQERTLPFNSSEYSCGQPSVSFGGNTLYFASDMPGGYGGMDLYFSRRKGDTWEAPVNLGPLVNTPGDEIYPFIHEDGILYFASDGLGGLGGFDIFYTHFDGSWNEPLNIGPPVNSAKDDFAFIIDREQESGFFTSDRRQGKGGDDLYAYRKSQALLRGRVIEADNREALEKAQVTIYAGEDRTEVILISKKNGQFSFPLEAKQRYKVRIEKEGYLAEEFDFDTFMGKHSGGLRKTFELERPAYVLQGQITDAQSGEYLPGARIRVLAGDLSRFADEDGRFELQLDLRDREKYPESLDCPVQWSNSMCISFGAAPPDTATFRPAFRWEMGDGTVLEGEQVNHCYEKPGRYLVRYILLDEPGGNIVQVMSEYELLLRPTEGGRIEGSDTVATGLPFFLEGKVPRDFNCETRQYLWDMGDGTELQGEVVNHIYRKPGLYKVRLLVKGIGGNCEECISRWICASPERPDPDWEVVYPAEAQAGLLHPGNLYFFFVDKPGYRNLLIPFRHPIDPEEELLKVQLTPEEINTEDLVQVEGQILEVPDNVPLSKVVITVSRSDGRNIPVLRGAQSTYRVFLDPDASYVLSALREGYLNTQATIKPGEFEAGMRVRLDVGMEKIEVGRSFVMKGIEFGSGSSEVLPGVKRELSNLAAFLIDNPGIQIELGNHTDSRGRDQSNLKISQERAQNCRQYLVERGIAPVRVIARGYGESKLLNECKNGVNCPEEAHAENRRTEIRILAYDKNAAKMLAQQKLNEQEKEEPNEEKILEENIEPEEIPFRVSDLDSIPGMGMPVLSEEVPVVVPEKYAELFSIWIGEFDTLPEPGFYRKLGGYKNATKVERVGDTLRFRVGNVSSKATAQRHLELLQGSGFNNARIIGLAPAGFVLPEEPKPVEVVVDTLPKLEFRVQIGAFGKRVPADFLEGLGDFSSKLIIEEVGAVQRYQIGSYDKSLHAERIMQMLKDQGYGDAFIAPYLDGVRITEDEALKLEAEREY